jgi:hypothetical protein
MSRRRPGLGAIVLSVATLFGVVNGIAEAQTLYAADGAGGNPNTNLYTLDPATGAVISTVGPIGFAVTGLAFHPSTGVLYGSTGRISPGAPNSLITVDPATGAGTLVGSYGVASQCGFDTMADIAFDPTTGVLYGWAEPCNHDLYRIDIATGQATKVGDSGLTTFGSGIAIDATGRILLAGGGAMGLLHAVDSTTGIPTVVATLSGSSVANISALAFDASGTLFGSLLNNAEPGRPSRLITIDPTTGLITDRGPSINSLDAIAFQPALFTFSFSGFFHPIDNPPAINIVTAGQAIPIRFSLGGDFGLDILADGYPKALAIPCSPGDPTDADDARIAPAGNTELSYNPHTDNYSFIWKTDRTWADTCRELTVRLIDGIDRVATFRFR